MQGQFVNNRNNKGFRFTRFAAIVPVGLGVLVVLLLVITSAATATVGA